MLKMTGIYNFATYKKLDLYRLKGVNGMSVLNRFSDKDRNSLSECELVTDSNNNSLVAYAVSSRGAGTYTYHVYMRRSDGTCSKSIAIKPSAVKMKRSSIGNQLLDFDGDFTETDISTAVNMLWALDVYHVLKRSDDGQSESLTDVLEKIRSWMLSSSDNEVRGSKGLNLRPVFAEKIKEETVVGIWKGDLPAIFNLLGIEMSSKTWVKDAVHHGWIRPTLKSDGSFERNDYNPPSCYRSQYGRRSPYERIYRFQFSDDEKKMIYDLVHADSPTIPRESVTVIDMNDIVKDGDNQCA